ncbi:hypothetical protein [Deefgea sp. CFH1-16]|uniref:hypothetical protein n=1 Tax=Deefgea sp. CFH1-16 TaxID=2675457 RepID=UPI0015F614D3|nr:hypothetical protein [Deefgea sp. CFH1-16]MBM5575722.1 hypothetical protein [Deefgea sp. CFH1-16]
MHFYQFRTTRIQGTTRRATVIFTDNQQRCCGHYIITVDDPNIPDEDVFIAAELFAIQKAFNMGTGLSSKPKTGRSMQLQVTFGAIKKLQAAESNKLHLIDYAHFLATRFHCAVITVENDDQPWLHSKRPAAQLFTVTEPDTEYVFCHALRAGVKVTRHAMHRLAERIENYQNSKDLYRTVVNSLSMQGNKLEVITPRERNNEKSIQAHGQIPVYVYDHLNGVYLILVKNGHVYDLKTAVANSEFADYSILGH